MTSKRLLNIDLHSIEKVRVEKIDMDDFVDELDIGFDMIIEGISCTELVMI